MSYSTFILISCGATVLCLALLVAALFRHKKSASQKIEVMGAVGLIEKQLDPEGTIIVNGELWRARLGSGSAMHHQARVRVVGARGHLLLVEPERNNL